MAIQQQANQTQPQRNRRIPRVRLVIAIIVSLLFAAVAVIGIVINLNSLSNILFIIFAIISALIALFQWLLPFSPVEPASPTDTAPSFSMVKEQVTPQTSPTQPSSMQPATVDIGNNISTVGKSLASFASSSAGEVAQPVGISQDKDFLLSYTDADLSYAKWIASQLEEAGYSTILRAWDFDPGSNFVTEMDEATKEAKRTILVLSPDYLKSFEEHPEWTVAFSQDMSGKGRKMLPVYVRECKQQLKGLLKPIIAIDLVGKSEAVARELLLDGVKPKGRPATPPQFPG